MLLDLPFKIDSAYHERITRPDFVHHLLGNGLLQAVVQVIENRDAHNALALHLMNPARFEGRTKPGSFTFHQQLGPELTTVALYHGGSLYVPHPRQTAADLRYGLDFAGGLPSFHARYPAEFTLDGRRAKSVWNVQEELFCPADLPALVRRVTVTNRRGVGPEPASLFAFLVPNQLLFPEAHYVTAADAAVAAHFQQGDEFLAVAGLGPSTAHLVAEFPAPFDAAAAGRLDGPSSDDGEYVRLQAGYNNYPVLPGSPHLGAVLALQFDLGALPPGASRSIDLCYVYGASEAAVLAVVAQVRAAGLPALQAAARQYWSALSAVRTGEAQLDTLFQAAQAGLRAGVSAQGHMNAGIWGYNAEWVRDSAMACVGATLSGQFEMARAMLAHILRDMVNDEGLTFGEGQWYTLKRAELDQNGELLNALWMYWAFARDDSLIRAHWPKLVALAEFPLRPEFWNEEAAMVLGERDVRERDLERHGLLPGFELAHQMWLRLGLSRAADMARLLGDDERAGRWGPLGARIWDSVLHHPKYALVEDGHLMKRRLPDGSFQRTAQSRPYVHRVDDRTTKMYSRSVNRSGELEPDSFAAWPIAYGLVEPESDLARNTLNRLELLWNQEWDFGGYPLHHVASEPTKLGAWPMTFYFITQAALQARHYDTARRNLDWMLQTPDGRGFAWWEYRDADPARQIDHGIVPWIIYGEPVILFVYHLLGFRPAPAELIIEPHLLPELAQAQARLRLGAHYVSLTLHNGGRYIRRVTVDGAATTAFDGDRATLPVPDADTQIEVWLED